MVISQGERDKQDIRWETGEVVKVNALRSQLEVSKLTGNLHAFAIKLRQPGKDFSSRKTQLKR